MVFMNRFVSSKSVGRVGLFGGGGGFTLEMALMSLIVACMRRSAMHKCANNCL